MEPNPIRHEQIPPHYYRSGHSFERGIRARRTLGTLGNKQALRPFLFAPCTKDVPINGDNELVFRWKPVKPAHIREYEFRLYRGLKTLHTHLMLSGEIDGQARSVALPAGTFADHDQYARELRQVYYDGQKSRTSYCSFELR